MSTSEGNNNGRGGKGRTKSRGRGRGRGRGGRRPVAASKGGHGIGNNHAKTNCLMVLHGNRQTGQLLLGRMEKLKRRLSKELQMDCVAPDAPFPHPEDNNLRTWWNREQNDYQGLNESLDVLRRAVSDQNSQQIDVVGLLGFSQGARLAHLAAVLHSQDPSRWFPQLRFVILVAGYDAPLPDNFPGKNAASIGSLSSLHVWGTQDPLISPEQSQAVMTEYSSPHAYEHSGKHFVPMNSPSMDKYVAFIHEALIKTSSTAAATNEIDQKPEGSLSTSQANVDSIPVRTTAESHLPPDEDTVGLQEDEVQALEAIFPDEFRLVSQASNVDEFELQYTHPIVYHLKLKPSDDLPSTDTTNWPKRELILEVKYPRNYPSESTPIIDILHENNIYEFPSYRVQQLQQIIQATATTELGMPSVLSCVYAARDYLDSTATESPTSDDQILDDSTDFNNIDAADPQSTVSTSSNKKSEHLIKASTIKQIQIARLQGLQIAEEILQVSKQGAETMQSASSSITGTGGSYGTFTIGLVGKPSAGKSTFFNAATAFSRKQPGSSADDNNRAGDGILGGASMAPHPFTTIDPNVGIAFFPAPLGSCPEDDYVEDKTNNLVFGSSHGRDRANRRFLPVLLKDVAGLVPGAYQGRGRGNQFLNDLCDAIVLIHVVDASGTADPQGNATHRDMESTEDVPFEDLAWIRNELVQWVYTNVAAKWDSVCRKGRTKLADMFSGYGQSQAVTWRILATVERYMEEHQNREHALDRIAEWAEEDLHRLVSAFLGVRFPMVLALNKQDLPQSRKNIELIQTSLPLHGAYVATPLAARSEMNFVRDHLLAEHMARPDGTALDRLPPSGIWQCLSLAMSRDCLGLGAPILVFPVSNMEEYTPLQGMSKVAVNHPSLPSRAMITCISAAGGTPPSCWSSELGGYVSSNKGRTTTTTSALRDVLLMKPGSTVSDVFLHLKRLGALGGEFVRAEGASMIGEKPKPIPKHELVGTHNRILKIMSTNRKTQWQT